MALLPQFVFRLLSGSNMEFEAEFGDKTRMEFDSVL
jgi:hypothetical protein